MDDLTPLRVLAAVRDAGTVTEAGAALGLSPSAVSQQLKRLGRMVGAPVTVRTGRRIALTPSAHQLLDRTTPLLDQLERAMRMLATERVSGRVRVVAFTTAIRAGLPATIAGLRRAHPALAIELVEVDPDDAYAALGAGRADIAVVHHWRGHPRPPHPTIEVSPVLDDPADIICRRDDPLAGRVPSPSDLVGRDWVSTGAGTLCHAWLTSMLVEAGGAPRITAQLSDYTVHVDFVRAGLGLALVPRLGRPPLPDDLVAVELPTPPSRVVSIAVRASQADDPTVRVVADALRGTLGAVGAGRG